VGLELSLHSLERRGQGYRVRPFEVESALVEHHVAAEAAVVGSPSPKRWQLVKGFVILKRP
jgi:4-hydroxybutyrate---CoA ligase (AMP-forming)